MLKYYVLNHDFNKDKIVNFNIFNNWILEEAVIKEIKKYLRGPNNYKVKRSSDNKVINGFDAFVEELRGLIMWQEWSRSQYEILVRGNISKNEKLEKVDCYMQCLPNIEMIAREVIYQYKQNIKNKSNE